MQCRMIRRSPCQSRKNIKGQRTKGEGSPPPPHSLPKRVPLNLCIGKPIPVRVAAEGLAFDSEVERVHALYKAELRRLYKENAAKFGYEDRELVFLCEKKGK